MNVLLVYPQYPDSFWSFKHVMRFISKKATVASWFNKGRGEY